MDERELASRMAGAADLVHDLAGVAFELPNDHIHNVGDEDVLLLRIRRKVDRACSAAHQRIASDEELFDVLELDLLLAAVAAGILVIVFAAAWFVGPSLLKGQAEKAAVHSSGLGLGVEVERAGMDNLREGQKLDYELEQGQRGRVSAVNLRPV